MEKRNRSEKWLQNRNKLKREKGKSYKGRKMLCGTWKFSEQKEERKLRPSCMCKRSANPQGKFQCRNFSKLRRTELFKMFWEKSWEAKRSLVKTYVHVTGTSDLKNRKDEGVSRRKNTYHYNLPDESDNLVPVCKIQFLNTLGLNESMTLHMVGSYHPHTDEIAEEVENDEEYEESCENSGEDSDEETDGEDVLNKNKNPSNKRSTVEDFLSNLPKMESHYCRKDTSRLYLEPFYTTKKEVFKAYATVFEKHDTASLTMFKTIMKEMKISLFKPKKDQCDTCVSTKHDLTDELIYKKHREEVEIARQEKEKDKANSKNIFTMDLQTVLLSPKLLTSSAYYKQKLVTHNFTLFDLISKEGFCFLWHEGEGGVTSNEFASLICKFILNHRSDICEGDELLMYSDGCNYQNRCAILSNGLLRVAYEKNITIIQKFLIKGHTQMECDSMHAAIERETRNREIYSPADYEAACRKAAGGKYFVEMVDHTYFIDFSPLKYLKSIRPGRKVGDKKVTDLRALKYNPEGTIDYKTDFSEDWQRLPQNCDWEDDAVCLQPLYLHPPGIKNDKYQHLQELKDVIPREHHEFYNNLLKH